MYDWDDDGTGNNTGRADHVGIVVSVTGTSMKIIEGNRSEAVAYRTVKVNGKYIRGFCLPDFASKAGEIGGGAIGGTGKYHKPHKMSLLLMAMALRRGR